MEQELVIKIVTIAAGVSVGGGFLIWFAKLMFQRLLRQYDEKLDAHEKKLEKISYRFIEQIHSLDIKIVKLEPMVALAASLREDIKAAEGDIAVLEHKDKEREKDIGVAFNQIRVIAKKLEH